MAKTNRPADSDRNPAEPIGTPPGGGRWTWDIPAQAWVDLDAEPAVQAQDVSQTTEAN